MNASVIICSRNRVDSLLETLDSLLEMVVPLDLSWEILVVDNASTDGTAQRAREWATRSRIPVMVLEEQRPGKSHALNLALAESKGDVLVFTDDDALVDRTWLTTALASLAENAAECVGGRVDPLWLATRPTWLTDRLTNVLAMLDLGPERRDLRSGDQLALYGVNYAFRRSVFDRLGGFSTIAYTRGAGNEDYDMMHRVQLAGGRVVYDPQMRVRHKVFPERVTKAYFRRWYYNSGRDRAASVKPGRQIFGLEAHIVRSFLGTLGSMTSAVARFNRDDIFQQELSCRLYLTYIQLRFKQFVAGRVPEVESGPSAQTVLDARSKAADRPGPSAPPVTSL